MAKEGGSPYVCWGCSQYSQLDWPSLPHSKECSSSVQTGRLSIGWSDPWWVLASLLSVIQVLPFQRHSEEVVIMKEMLRSASYASFETWKEPMSTSNDFLLSCLNTEYFLTPFVVVIYFQWVWSILLIETLRATSKHDRGCVHTVQVFLWYFGMYIIIINIHSCMYPLLNLFF